MRTYTNIMHKSTYDATVPTPKQSSKVQQTYMELCSRLANKSQLQHKHGCVIVQEGKVIGMGYNTKIITTSIHAEMAALHHAKKRIGGKHELDLYVVRIGTPRHYKYKYSKPCERCAYEISKFQIKRVFYSVNQCVEVCKWNCCNAKSVSGTPWRLRSPVEGPWPDGSTKTESRNTEWVATGSWAKT